MRFSFPSPCINLVAERTDKNAVLNIMNAPMK
jgi:hypothetical protein